MKYSRKGFFKFLAVISVFLLIIVVPAFTQSQPDGDDCTTLAVGKAASATGDVLVAHNEDDGGRMAMTETYVPRMNHATGELVNGGNLESGEAQIPQVPLTYAFYWSEARTPGGASFADVFRNEFGVTVLSNSAANSKETCSATCLVNGGIGYGLRTAIAQRATSARNGVEVAIGLLNQYGYAASGRMYTIADGKEVWSLQVVKGKHYVAQRLGDNEVFVISNRYTIRQVDMVDATTTHKKYYASPDLITYATAQGWYTCTECVKYSDFDFGKVYQSTSTWNSDGNIIRQRHGWSILFGLSYPNADDIPFSVVAPRKVGIDDLKAVERSHYEGTPD